MATDYIQGAEVRILGEISYPIRVAFNAGVENYAAQWKRDISSQNSA